MTHKNTTYTAPEETADIMAKEAMPLQYSSIDALQHQCIDMIMQLKDSSVLVDIIHRLNNLVAPKEESLTPYTLEELRQRCDEATAELEAGGGVNGDTFFRQLNAYIESL